MLTTIKQLAVTFIYLLIYIYNKELYLNISIHSRVTLNYIHDTYPTTVGKLLKSISWKSNLQITRFLPTHG